LRNARVYRQPEKAEAPGESAAKPHIRAARIVDLAQSPRQAADLVEPLWLPLPARASRARLSVALAMAAMADATRYWCLICQAASARRAPTRRAWSKLLELRA
jgi:hypothetical protein